MSMINRLHDLSSAVSLASLETQSIKICHDFDFEICTLESVTVRKDQPALTVSAGNIPAAFHQWGMGLKNDPVITKLRNSKVPIVYDASTFVTPDERDWYDLCSSFGFKTGVCLALRVSANEHFMFGFDRTLPLPKDGDQLARLMADVQLVATYAHSAAARVLHPSELVQVQLSIRERDVLAWTVEGKTNGVIAQILQISEHTVKTHIRSAMVKLDTSTRHRAAAKALSLGLLR